MMRRGFRLGLMGSVLALLTLFTAEFFQLSRTTPFSAKSGELADLIVVEKLQRRLVLMRGGQVFREYRVALGRNPVGHKQREGDNRTPEGRYSIDFAHARSGYHLALRISYPDAGDSAVAKSRNEPPGSDIMIHGIRNGFGFIGGLHRLLDWTNGCIAVTNPEIEEIWAYVRIGTPVEIRA